MRKTVRDCDEDSDENKDDTGTVVRTVLRMTVRDYDEDEDYRWLLFLNKMAARPADSLSTNKMAPFASNQQRQWPETQQTSFPVNKQIMG
ncbi:hypothetical protein ACOMHN_001886 [Nucella lapillus]